MKVGSFLLGQLEKCGLSAQLAEQHAEASADASGFRLAKIEIARSFHANDQPTITEADAALHWLVGEPGKIVSVGESLDLVDQATGEVLVSGRPGAVLVDPCMVVSWRNADAFDDSEPEDDLGLVAMGLAASMAAGGQPFRVATLAIRGRETFPRRSPEGKPEFMPAGHPALLARIKAAVGRPRVACPGEWCGGCRQAVYCPAWLARAKTALAVMGEQIPSVEADATPQVDLTNENAGAFSERIEYAEKAAKLAKDILKRFVRNGGRCVKNGKQLHLGSCDGRKTVSADDLLSFSAMRTIPADALADVVSSLKGQDGHVVCLKSELEALVKVGNPYETSSWKKVASAVKGGKR
jgi:hypothetical protein